MSIFTHNTGFTLLDNPKDIVSKLTNGAVAPVVVRSGDRGSDGGV